jgi:hypothetical protein
MSASRADLTLSSVFVARSLRCVAIPGAAVAAPIAASASMAAPVHRGLDLASTLLASGVIGPDTTAYHLLGYVAAVLTALGFQALPTSTAAADKPAA